jgi:protein-disulfide isomerase
MTGVLALALVGAVLFFGPASREPRQAEDAPSAVAPSKVEAAAAPAASGAGPLASPPAREPQPPPQASTLSDVDPRKAFGSKSAPITMEVFSDFQCPACKQLYKATNQQLMDNYVNTSKVYLVHRDFPLPMHAYSRIAARYARAAAQLGKSEQAEQTLFQNQERWEQSGDIDGTLAAVFSATEMNKIRAQAKGSSFDAVIDRDVALGKGYNVNQTPTTIIRYKGQTYPVVGIVSYDMLHQFLDQLLSQR